MPWLRAAFVLLPVCGLFFVFSGGAAPPVQYVNSVRKPLPADAAPPAQQVLRMMSPEPRSLDAQVNLYDAEATILPWEPLLTRDEMWQPEPAAAETYTASKDGKTWTFRLRRGARWSDGRPVTAHDFVYAFRRMLDPAAANPYAFFYYDIKNAEPISQGKIKDLAQLGVRAVDDLTLVVETERATPYFPHIASFPLAYPAPRWAIEKYGRRWTEADKIVSNASFKMAEWVRGSHMTFVPDPLYNGPHKPFLEKVVHPFREDAVATVMAYENSEVDIEAVDINDLDRIQKHPVMGKELVKAWGRTTWYLFFKVSQPPFADIRVREAFARAIDREAICRVVLRGTAAPAYAMVPPDFKEYNGPAMKPYQSYDPARARQLMQAAGYPNGRGFPKQEMWLRAPTPSLNMVAVALQSMLRENLGVDVTIRSADRTAYMSKLYDWEMNFGFLRFVADYVDPRNMLDMTWHSQPRGVGRHDWSNAEFDRLVEAAGAELDPVRRTQLYRRAEEILVRDYAAAFVFHPQNLELRKPWIKGYGRNPDGTVGSVVFTKLYIGKR
jgi:ABC-type oligopeptide transport system substrate-binding subunit